MNCSALQTQENSNDLILIHSPFLKFKKDFFLKTLNDEFNLYGNFF